MKHMNGLEIPENLAEAADPARTALIVYDMQVGILKQMKDGGLVLERVRQLLESARAARVPVIFMRHMSLPVKLAGSFQLRQAMAWQKVTDPAEVRP